VQNKKTKTRNHAIIIIIIIIIENTVIRDISAKKKNCSQPSENVLLAYNRSSRL